MARAAGRTRGLPSMAAGVPIGKDAWLFAMAGVPVAGVSGSFKGLAGKGSLVVDVTNAKLYINTNTKASPTWVVTGTQT